MAMMKCAAFFCIIGFVLIHITSCYVVTTVPKCRLVNATSDFPMQWDPPQVGLTLNDSTPLNTKIATFYMSMPINNVTFASFHHTEYVDVTWDENSFTVYVHKDLSGATDYDDLDSLQIRFHEFCEGDAGRPSRDEATLYISLLDTNNERPTFVKDNYEIEVDVPFPAKVPLNEKNPLQLYDMDRNEGTNGAVRVDDITHPISVHFIVKHRFGNKNYTVILVPEEPLEYDPYRPVITFPVIAHDRGTPRLYGNTTVTLKLNP